MAEIFRARLASQEGAGRLVVIKRILANYGKNIEFRKMFKSEIKVMMGFNHPNIVHFYDYGEFRNQPFIAMEHVDGKNLRQYINKLSENKKTMPVEMAVQIIEQVAGGLHYAHQFKDKMTGEPLQLVHRDVSPQNILVSFDGTVKIVDFGIAKANTNTDQTRVGIIKGKPSYLSPEQITGIGLDARSDVFALGAVLWEVLTGRKLFAAKKGENEFSVLKLIESCDTFVKPPSQFNPEIPSELDVICLKALTKDRKKRYQSADEFQRALQKFLHNSPNYSNPQELSSLAKDLFKDFILEDRKKLAELNQRAESLINDDFTILNSNNNLKSSDHHSDKHAGGTREFDAGQVDTTGIKIDRVPVTKKQQSKPVSRMLPKSESFSHAGTKTTSNQTESSPLKKIVAVLAVVGIGLFLFADELGLNSKGKNETHQQTAQNSEPKKLSVPFGGDSILLKLEIRPGFGGGDIFLNGERLSEDSLEVKVPLDQPLELQIDKKNFRSFKREFVLSSTDFKGIPEHLMQISLEPKSFGYVSIYTTPSADAYIYPADDEARSVASGGKPWILRAPFQSEKFPIGKYVIKLENKVLAMEKEILIEVEEGKDLKRNEQLELMK